MYAITLERWLCLDHTYVLPLSASLDFVNLYTTQPHTSFSPGLSIYNNQLTELPEGLLSTTAQLRDL